MLLTVLNPSLKLPISCWLFDVLRAWWAKLFRLPHWEGGRPTLDGYSGGIVALPGGSGAITLTLWELYADIDDELLCMEPWAPGGGKCNRQVLPDS